MCVKILIEIPKHDTYLAQIAETVELDLPLDLHLESENVAAQPMRLSISERDRGCGCSLVVDTKDWEKHFWRIRPEYTSPIAEALGRIAKFSKAPFNFSMVWLGVDRPEPSSEEATLPQIASIIRQNQIVPARKYVVQRAG